MRMPITQVVKTVRVMNAVAAGTSVQNGTGVDMTGYDAVRFIALIGTLTATQVTSLKAQDSSDNSTFADITSGATTAMADGDSNKMLVCDVIRPAKRYVRPVLSRATANAVIDGIIAELYQTRALPVTADASVSKSVTVGPLA